MALVRNLLKARLIFQVTYARDATARTGNLKKKKEDGRAQDYTKARHGLRGTRGRCKAGRKTRDREAKIHLRYG